MNQTFIITINNISSESSLIYIDRISKLYNFKIKKLFPDINGALISIISYNTHFLYSNKKITILDDNEIYNNPNVAKMFNFDSYKLLMKFKYL